MQDDKSAPGSTAETGIIGSLSYTNARKNDLVDGAATGQAKDDRSETGMNIAHPDIESSHASYTSKAFLESHNTDCDLAGFNTEDEQTPCSSANSSQWATVSETPNRDGASTQDISTVRDGNELTIRRGMGETSPRLDNNTTNSSMPASCRPYSHTSRRHRLLHQMESISETGIVNDREETHSRERQTGIVNDREETAFEDGDSFIEDSFIHGGSSRSYDKHNLTHNNSMDSSIDPNNVHVHNPDNMDIVASTSSSLSTPRRRAVVVGESSGSTSGNSSDSAQGSSSGGSSGTRRNRQVMRNDLISARRRHVGVESNDGSDTNTGIRRRSNNRGNSLAIQLDAGMASLRRWIRARRSSVEGGAAGTGSTTSGHSLSSMTTIRLGEDDIFALSHTGRDLRRPGVTASSASSDPSLNISEYNCGNGFLYYRPFEVHVRHDVDAEIGIYGSDDESGTRSILLHPLVSSEDSRVAERGSRQLRQRAYSEPDRARIVDFFSSIFGSRAIDGGNVADGTLIERAEARYSQSRHRNLNTRAVVSSPPILMEETEVADQDINPSEDQSTTSRSVQSSQQLSLFRDSRQLPASVAGDSGTRLQSGPPSSTNDAELPTAEISEFEHAHEHAHDPSTTVTPTLSDPDREARTRWMRINRHFQCIVTSVAVLFSLLLFCILITWVLLTSTIVLSHNKASLCCTCIYILIFIPATNISFPLLSLSHATCHFGRTSCSFQSS